MQNYKGQVRRVDELGRVVIPKEIRFALKVNSGSLLEFFCDQQNNAITLTKYEPIKQITDYAIMCMQALKEYLNFGFLLCDNSSVIWTINLPKTEYIGFKLNNYALEESYKLNKFNNINILEQKNVLPNVVLPIKSNGEVWGSIVVIGKDISTEVLSSAKTVCKIISNYISE